jgi:hypothetical protein
MADQYFPNLDVMMIYRLDRFGRGGHRPFNEAGFRGVRVMEAFENYNRQHQDLRTENGIEYGDVIEGVNFPSAVKMAGLNAVTMASIAMAPAPPQNVKIEGAVQPSTTLKRDKSRRGKGLKCCRLQGVLAPDYLPCMDQQPVCRQCK